MRMYPLTENRDARKLKWQQQANMPETSLLATADMTTDDITKGETELRRTKGG